MISGEICGVIFFLAKKPTFDQCLSPARLFNVVSKAFFNVSNVHHITHPEVT